MMSAMGTKRKSSVHSASVSSWHKADIFRPDSHRESDLRSEPAFSGSSALYSCGFLGRYDPACRIGAKRIIMTLYQ